MRNDLQIILHRMDPRSNYTIAAVRARGQKLSLSHLDKLGVSNRVELVLCAVSNPKARTPTPLQQEKSSADAVHRSVQKCLSDQNAARFSAIGESQRAHAQKPQVPRLRQAGNLESFRTRPIWHERLEWRHSLLLAKRGCYRRRHVALQGYSPSSGSGIRTYSDWLSLVSALLCL
jgi:hypothetical protein